MKLKILTSIKALFDGMIVVFEHLFRKAVTLEYPEIKRELNNNFRGKPIVEGCIGCGMCVFYEYRDVFRIYLFGNYNTFSDKCHII